MIEFDLEKALAGEKVVTRDGREVTQLVNFMVMTGRSLCGVVDKELCTWLIDGSRRVAGQDVSRYKLFMAPKKHKGFIGVCMTNKRNTFISNPYDSADEVKEACEGSNLLSIIDLSDFEEGHGL